MQQNIISVNPTNWITIVAMVALTYFLIGAAVAVMKQRKGAPAAE